MSGSRNSSGKSSQTRRNTGRNTSKKPVKKTQVQKNDRSAEVMAEVAIMIAFLCCVLWMLCNCNVIHTDFAAGVRALTFGIFGLISYIFPMLLVLFVAFCYMNRGNSRAYIMIAGMILLLISVGSVTEMAGGYVKTHADDLGSFKELTSGIWAVGHDEFKGGGVLFGWVAALICNFLGKIGVWLVSIFAILAAFVMMTGKSILKAVKGGSEVVMGEARKGGKAISEGSESLRESLAEKLARRKEENAIRRQEEHRLAEEKKLLRQQQEALKKEQKEDDSILRRDHVVRGVMLDPRVSDIPADEVSSPETVTASAVNNKYDLNDVHEINIVSSNDVTKASAEVFSGAAVYEGSNMKEISPVDLADIPQPITARTPDKKPEPAYETAAETVNRNFAQGFDEPVRTESKNETKASEEEMSSTDTIPSGDVQENYRRYKLPPVDLLDKPSGTVRGDSDEDLRTTAAKLRDTLETFGVKVTVTGISQGPSVTRFEIQPEIGVSVNRITKLSDDIKLALAATDIRIEAPIPGKSAVGIEVPNKEKTSVSIRELIDTKEFRELKSKISFTVGRDLAGKMNFADIAKMPHMLIAGATGSGKSVCINSIIMSILFKAKPDEVKLLMIDPKVVELNIYNGIPHLLLPVVTDCKLASNALKWGVNEMALRYKIFAECNVRDMKSFNEMVGDGKIDFEGKQYGKMPEIVIIVDELADLMMVASKEVEESICRLAQLARAAGIHLIIATQRPSVDVITGLIKANMPSRIAFAVTSGVDSRTILDSVGAERLLGKGDMLYYPQGYSKPARIQGVYVKDEEIVRVVDFIKKQGFKGTGSVAGQISAMGSGAQGSAGNGSSSQDADLGDELFAEAGRFIITNQKASIGALQRKFKIGFNRAARLMDSLADEGVVGPEEGTKPRTILMSIEQFEEYLN